MGHDIFNASSTATWIECPWSARNAVPEPPRKQSTIDAADAGTRAHEDLEAGEIAEVEIYIDKLEHGLRRREMRVRITDECGGTLDFANFSERITTVLDGKFGKWDVPAFHNKQLFTYSAAILPNTTAEWFRFVIYQPNGLDDDPWKQWLAHRSEVEAHKHRVVAAINDRGPPKPGPHCRWCKAFQVCPAMAQDASFLIGAMSRDPLTLTPDEIVRMLRLIRALGDVKEVYEDVLTTRLKMGYAAKDATLKPGRSFRAWNDAEQAASVLYQSFGPRGVKPVSPAQAEKLGIAGKQYVSIGAHKPEAPLKAAY